MTNENKKDEGRPAFPTPERTFKTGVWYSDGMTLRDYFAGMALANPYTFSDDSPNKSAEWAYSIADAMLEARKK